MKTSIAILALLLAAALRPAPEFPAARRPVPPAEEIQPASAAPLPGILEALARGLLPTVEPSRRQDPDRIEAVPRTLEPVVDDPDPTIESVRRKLATMKMDLAFEDTKIEDILAFIRDTSGLNILLDAAVRDQIEPDRRVTFKAKDLALNSILKLLLSPFQLDVRITDEAVVLITDPGRAATAAAPVFAETARNVLGSPATDPTPFDAVLDATRVDLDVQNWPLSAIVAELRSRTGLDLQLRGDVEGMISVNVAQIGLRALLKLLLEPRNLRYLIDGVTVWIGDLPDPDRY